MPIAASRGISDDCDGVMSTDAEVQDVAQAWRIWLMNPADPTGLYSPYADCDPPSWRGRIAHASCHLPGHKPPEIGCTTARELSPNSLARWGSHLTTTATLLKPTDCSTSGLRWTPSNPVSAAY